MPSKYPKLKSKKRTITGRKVKKLRKEGILPANIYGKGIKSQAIEIPLKEFSKIYSKTGETGLVELIIDTAKPRTILIHNVQKDVVSGDFLHVDFRQVDLTKKIIAAVPIVVKDEAPAVSIGGVQIQIMNEIEVEALPSDLPEKIEADVKKLEEIGQSLTAKELKYDKKKIKLQLDNLDSIIIKIEAPAKEEEKPVEETKEEEEEAVEEGKEGETKEGEKDKGEEKKKEEKKKEGKKSSKSPLPAKDQARNLPRGKAGTTE